MVFSRKSLTIIASLFITAFSFAGIVQHEEHSAPVSTTEAHAEAVEAEGHEGHAEPTGIKGQIDAYKKHHVLDSHDFTLFSDNKEGKHFGFPLPVILVDEGFHVFSSSKFNHGESVAESNGKFYVINHHDGKIYRTDAQGTITEDANGHPTNVHPLDLSITKSVFSILLAALLMFWLFTSLAKSYKKNNGIAVGIGRYFEPLVVFIRDEIAIPNIGVKHHRRYMGYLLTIFFFILFLNLFGLTPLGINVTGNIAITFALAIMTFFITTFTANKNYWMHIFWMPGVPKLMRIVLAPIELLGIIIKPFSLMIRLYANIFAGHIVLMSIIGLMFIFKSWLGSSLSFGLAFVLSILEILVAFLQAYIFTMLSALYFGAAVEEHHHEEHH
ncbi:MAG: ATP synthase F0 subunit A [Flavobacterium sp.]|uniref:F0F1 ATP synthase subunit A n=1 Tax=Flavobacterium sp. TaxID=239 RepID=UPI0011FB5C28|nr:F0F1 ATP synthase subunit A [Flavobacterium sp.]RZJ67882.1 MAG: ATP synthase F0 subunit A [Flavobacterium sp.]